MLLNIICVGIGLLAGVWLMYVIMKASGLRIPETEEALIARLHAFLEHRQNEQFTYVEICYHLGVGVDDIDNARRARILSQELNRMLENESLTRTSCDVSREVYYHPIDMCM